ncbi:unnamed protein product [Diatraea saccharalis]|uniref:DNA repair and recombination protein RAD54-like n=1 Tax=Diatraea saccharalis TaxID=40085 RepID=A0A9N9WDH8_9NEOP|nr:unnamed protein product [Diatraea saccharalis]
MVDINKYLETQLALAKQKSEFNNSRSIPLISQKSKSVAEIISKKEEKQFKKNKSAKSYSKPRAIQPIEKPDTFESKDSDDESEYIPSCDEDEEINSQLMSSSTRTKNNLKKIIDDGAKTLYDKRIKVWREKLATALENKIIDVPTSADIQYILEGNKDFDKVYELQNGLCVPNYIWKQLFKYQKTGVKWLWELHQVQSGGLLGDEMGLGKTVQIIAFLAALSITDFGSWGGLGPSIIVAPATVIYQWVTHFHFWCPSLRVSVLHNSGSHNGDHNKLIRDINESHGILLITYAGIVKYSNDLLSRKWHYIILDEGHKIRNPETQISKHVKKFKTPHKLLITGSPMQNSLQELWSLFDFMRPGLLGTYNTFMEYFANPITQGGYANATEIQEATALEIAITLKSIITPYMLRRTKSEVQEYIKLPEKNEQVLFCALSQEQRDLYMGYLMGSTVRSILDKECRYGDPLRARVLVALSTLRKICNHPDLYLYEIQEDDAQILDENFGHWKRCGKMTVVNSLLKIWQKQGHRALIFSQSRVMLCLLEQYLQSQDFKYLKMDGGVTISQRQNMIKTFNENTEYLVFLSTTRVGGLGVNLTGADRVIIYDPDWNPATDNQAKERAWRIGQQRNVTVYRLVSAGTIEEKIYQRQIFKHFLSNKILIDPNQKNVLTTSTLQGLFTLDEPNPEGDTETSSLFKNSKVYANKGKEKNSSTESKSAISKRKMEAMKKMAKEISRRITKNIEEKSCLIQEDPRERYKKKREMLINPPKIEEPEINKVDDKVTNATFESIMSELDIVNMHTKEDYEKKLLEDVLNKANDNNEAELTTESSFANTDNKNVGIKHDEMNEFVNHLDPPEPSSSKSVNDNALLEKKDEKRPKKRSPSSEAEIESLIAIKKVKRNKSRTNKKQKDDDDYVLSKLFAKASVKTALQHDIVVGLAEKEKRHRMKEEATRKAKKALRAIKFSWK